jgi:hypothetical protein
MWENAVVGTGHTSPKMPNEALGCDNMARFPTIARVAMDMVQTLPTDVLMYLAVLIDVRNMLVRCLVSEYAIPPTSTLQTPEHVFSITR